MSVLRPIPATTPARPSASEIDNADWRPGAALNSLRRRAEALQEIRTFFTTRGVLEVETPILAARTVTDPHLHSLDTRFVGPGAPAGYRLYLQTSPEFAMKRLLAAGSGPIYQIARAFRNGEAGRLHNPEFTLLEWYRPGFDHHAMMDEVEDLVRTLLALPERFDRLTYGDIFRRGLGIDPHTASARELRVCAYDHGLGGPADPMPGREGWLDLLLSHVLQPALGGPRPVFIHDYPVGQAALARVSGEPPVAERFELYIRGVELANGYHELSDPGEQRRRFERDLVFRRNAGLPEIEPDERLLAALAHGLPDCAGVALGVDRLLMLAAGVESIKDVLGFDLERA